MVAAMCRERGLSEVIRAAISEHIAARRKVGQFQEGLKARIDRARHLLDRQADS